MPTRRLKKKLNAKVQRILSNAALYHGKFYRAQRFTGPSLHFHRRAMGLTGPISFDQKVELVYAVLTAWGMHRMGKGGSKMVPFSVFRQSILSIRRDIQHLSAATPAKMSSTAWAQLERVFKGVHVMASKTKLVGHSKVMAHFLPNLVPPIDRQYTIKYLFGTGAIKNGVHGEWLLMKKILTDFFYPVVSDKGFQAKAASWIGNQGRWWWDTSSLKVVDNLVIGAMR